MQELAIVQIHNVVVSVIVNKYQSIHNTGKDIRRIDIMGKNTKNNRMECGNMKDNAMDMGTNCGNMKDNAMDMATNCGDGGCCGGGKKCNKKK